ncbi:MAG: DUF6062 family protein [Clostridiales bacterium]|nr:DUF6062 family protein [Clostridiales bacterium]
MQKSAFRALKTDNQAAKSAQWLSISKTNENAARQRLMENEEAEARAQMEDEEMKEEIYTIPVMDAFNESEGCPFCAMQAKLEKESVEYCLGPSYMEDDIRMETDKFGFCQKHYEELLKEQNRLGLALIISTHLKRISSFLADAPVAKKAKGFFSKSSDPLEPLKEVLDQASEGCFICSRVGGTFLRYAETFLYMWPKTQELRGKFEKSPLCLKHFAMLVKLGSKEMPQQAWEQFYPALAEVQSHQLQRLEADLDLFIKKFDYRYRDAPVGDSRDAVPRAIKILAGCNPDEI